MRWYFHAVMRVLAFLGASMTTTGLVLDNKQGFVLGIVFMLIGAALGWNTPPGDTK